MLRILVLIGFMASPLVAAAQEVTTSVRAGQTVQIYSWSFFNKECDVTKFPKFTVRAAPQLGKVSTTKGPIKINRVIDPAMNKCIGRSVDGTLVMYTAGANKGVDKFSIARRRLNGRADVTDFAITIK